MSTPIPDKPSQAEGDVGDDDLTRENPTEADSGDGAAGGDADDRP